MAHIFEKVHFPIIWYFIQLSGGLEGLHQQHLSHWPCQKQTNKNNHSQKQLCCKIFQVHFLKRRNCTSKWHFPKKNRSVFLIAEMGLVYSSCLNVRRIARNSQRTPSTLIKKSWCEMYKVKMFHSFGCFTIEWFYTLSVWGVVVSAEYSMYVWEICGLVMSL